MTKEKFIQCGKCGKVNPASARTCMDCNGMLEQAPKEKKKQVDPDTEPENISTYDKIESLHKNLEADRKKVQIEDLATVERFDWDDTEIGSSEMQGIQRIGDEIIDQPGNEGEIQTSRAYEVESHSLLSEEEDETEFKLAVELETSEDAQDRVSTESSKFTRKTMDPQDKTPAPTIKSPSKTPVPFPTKPKAVPKHKSPWERSDVEIMTSIRRKNIMKGLLSRTVLLLVIAAALAFAGNQFLFSTVLPGGTWHGSMIDHIGDSSIVRFTMELERSGENLTGTFWLVEEHGDPVKGGVPVPFSLQQLYKQGRPLQVSGTFTRKQMNLTIFNPLDEATGNQVVLEGDFKDLFHVEGAAVNTKNIQSTWTLEKQLGI